MRMMSRAIEDAADFSAFRDALTRRNQSIIEADRRPREENRAQRRARERAKRKAAKKQVKA